ncbi:hypothetical protein CDD83_9527 [Cordyceps sp. RAO-2017]|nr:hypothetical protein CDD83_9527 [Cordyceps sp. RAO-2017]
MTFVRFGSRSLHLSGLRQHISPGRFRYYTNASAIAAPPTASTRTAKLPLSGGEPDRTTTGGGKPAAGADAGASKALRNAEAREAALRAARARRRGDRDDCEAAAAKKRLEEEDYRKRYRSAARKWVAGMTALPFLIVTSYMLFDRLVLGNTPKQLPAQPAADDTQGKAEQ